MTFSISKPDSLSLDCLISIVVVGLIDGGGGWIFLCLGRKKIFGFVFKFVGWVCVCVCWLGLIGGGGGWIFLCLGREKISRFGFGWKENFWICV